MSSESTYSVDYPPESNKRAVAERARKRCELKVSDFLELESMLREDEREYDELQATLAEREKDNGGDTGAHQNDTHTLKGALDTKAKHIRALQRLIANARPMVEQKMTMLLKKTTKQNPQ